MEAITSRPLLLAAVGRATHSSVQTTLYLTPLHGKANLLKPLLANIHAALLHVKAAAEQFKTADRWAVLLAQRVWQRLLDRIKEAWRQRLGAGAAARPSAEPPDGHAGHGGHAGHAGLGSSVPCYWPPARRTCAGGSGCARCRGRRRGVRPCR